MSYGDTYSREPTKEERSRNESLISCLCNESGYNRENLEGIELEAKIDLSPKSPVLTLGEDLLFPEPYSRDRILEVSEARHSCYAFVDRGRRLIPAFTKVVKNGVTKVKVKKEETQLIKDNVWLLRRDEKHFTNLSQLELNRYISEMARQSNLPLEYVGTFLKQSKEAFVFNPASGRIFVVATNVCETESCSSTLYQLELEYYGQINGFSSTSDVKTDLGFLVEGVLKSIPRRYKAKSSTLTKFDWFVNAKK